MAYPTNLNFLITENQAGLSPITQIDTTQRTDIGKMVRARDILGNYGEAWFVYMPGVASNLAGNIGFLDYFNKTFTLAATAGRGICGIAMSAALATQFGWVCIEGVVPVACTGVGAISLPCYLTATPGSMATTVSATNKLDGTIVTVAVSGGFATVQLDGPCVTGNG